MRQREHVTTGSQDSRPLIVMIAAEDLEMLKKSQQQILERLDKLGAGQPLKRSVAPSYVTAK
ncbi:MAG: hypothetical protein Q8932_01775 [Bacteroidota bacterium]|nr:hypothetical protein [Bacteroidota bacterium]